MVSVARNNTPALRFDGLDGEWEKVSLGDLGIPISGVGFPHSEQGGETGTPFFKVSDMGQSDNQRELLYAANYVSAEQIKQRRWQVSNGPAVVFAKVGAAVLLDRKRLVRETFLADNNLMAFVISQSVLLPDFSLSLFETLSLSSLVQVGALPSINGSQVQAMMVSIPPTFQEQRAVGELFADLDALIEQHRAKHANLQQTKTALMQCMFPQDGADEPELRVGGFSGAWEPKKVDEICPLQRGFDLPASEMVEGSVPVVTSNGVVRHHNKALVKGPGVTTGRSGTIGKVHFVEQDYWPHNTSLWVTDFKGNDPRFVYHLLQRIDPSRFSSGSGVPTLNRNDLHDFVSHIPPTLEEQRAIGEVFSNLDALITSEHRYITQLTQAKTVLLQRMFV